VAGRLVIGADLADPSILLTLGTLGARLAYLPAAIIGGLRPAPRVAGQERLASASEAAGGRYLSMRDPDESAVTIQAPDQFTIEYTKDLGRVLERSDELVLL